MMSNFLKWAGISGYRVMPNLLLVETRPKMKSWNLDDDFSFEATEFTGPFGILRTRKDSYLRSGILNLAGGIVGRYSDAPRGQIVKLTIFHKQMESEIDCQMLNDSMIRKLSI